MLNINSISTMQIIREVKLPPASEKTLNTVLNAIRKLDDITPVEIVRHTGLSQGCVHRAVISLFTDNIITRTFASNNGRYKVYSYSVA